MHLDIRYVQLHSFFYRVQLGCTQPTHSTLTPHAHTRVRPNTRKEEIGRRRRLQCAEMRSTTKRARVRVP